jgi:hypothetical protein
MIEFCDAPPILAVSVTTPTAGVAVTGSQTFALIFAATSAAIVVTVLELVKFDVMSSPHT